MTLYRLGRYEEARGVLERSHLLRTEKRRARPETVAFLAMAHHRLGREDESRRSLEKGIEGCQREMQENPAWNRRITLELYRAEAEELLETAKPLPKKEVIQPPQETEETKQAVGN